MDPGKAWVIQSYVRGYCKGNGGIEAAGVPLSLSSCLIHTNALRYGLEMLAFGVKIFFITVILFVFQF